MRLAKCLAAAGLAMCAISAGTPVDVAAQDLPRCLFVSSYHHGYAWSDGVEAGLRAVLDGKCEVRQFDMDTKRRKSEADKQAAAREAKSIIEDWRPDVVITADDNAARYLIKPFYRDHRIPFVFCGVNWTVDEYGFPYTNVTGMIEVAPIVPMLNYALEASSGAGRALYLGADTLTEQKNLKRFRAAAARLGFELDHVLAPTMREWRAAYRAAQDYDFVIIGSRAGINDWDSDAARHEVLHATRRFSVTSHDWMMPYTILGVTKMPQEHGEWAGRTALSILDGTSPDDIPIVSNSRRDLWLNAELLNASGLIISDRLARRAKRIGTAQPRS